MKVKKVANCNDQRAKNKQKRSKSETKKLRSESKQVTRVAAMFPAARGSLLVAAAREKPENLFLHRIPDLKPPSVTEQVIIQLRRPPTRPQIAPDLI